MEYLRYCLGWYSRFFLSIFLKKLPKLSDYTHLRVPVSDRTRQQQNIWCKIQSTPRFHFFQNKTISVMGFFITVFIKVVCPQDDISRLYLYPDGKENSAAKQNLAAISNEIKLKSVKREPGCDVMAEPQVWSLWSQRRYAMPWYCWKGVEFQQTKTSS